MSRSIFLAMVMLLGAAACGPKPGGKLPVSSPVYAFQVPDAEDFDAEVEDDEADDTIPPDDVE